MCIRDRKNSEHQIKYRKNQLFLDNFPIKIKELVEKTGGGPVRIAYPNGIAGLPSQLRKPAYSASVGALLWGIKHQGEGRRYPSPPKNLWNYQSLVKRLVRNKQEISN